MDGVEMGMEWDGDGDGDEDRGGNGMGLDRGGDGAARWQQWAQERAALSLTLLQESMRRVGEHRNTALERCQPPPGELKGKIEV